MLPKTDWCAPQVAELPSWKEAKRVGIDIETKDPCLRELGIGVRRGGRIIGVSFSLEDGPSFYLPTGHTSGNLSEKLVLSYLQEQMEGFGGILTGANLPYDLDYLEEYGVTARSATIRDIQVVEPILDENQYSYSLETLAAKYGIAGKEETLLAKVATAYGIKTIKSSLADIPAGFVGPYAERDASLPLKILRKQERLIEDQDLWDILNLECKVTPVLISMRRRGLLVSLPRLEKVTKHIEHMMLEMVAEINRLSKVKIALSDIKKTRALIPLIQSLGATIPKTAATDKFPNGQQSITKAFLDTVDHPVASALRAARSFHTMKTTFCNSMYKYMTPDGRIHSTFNQLKASNEQGTGTRGTVTGRLSSCHPNVQNQPIRHPELGAVWRGIYLPEEGCTWVSSDYASQEPRLTVHYAEIQQLPGAKEEGDRFRADPSADAYAKMVALTGLARKEVKAILLGKSYGMGDARFCRDLGLPVAHKKRYGEWREVAGEEGQAMLDTFDREVPYIKILARQCKARANSVGRIRTLGGRDCHFPVDSNGKYMGTHKAMNKLIQGSAAVQMKMAMVQAHEAGVELRLQVHDELNISARSQEDANQLRDIMVDAVELRVPTYVDLETGRSWGEIDDDGIKKCKEFYGD